MSEAVELEPCPHCSGRARLMRKTGVHGTACKSKWLREWVACQGKTCGASSAVFKRPGQAIAAWNRRAKPAEGEPVAWRCEVNGNVAWFEDWQDVTAATKDFADVLVAPLYTRPAAWPDREAVARFSHDFVAKQSCGEWGDELIASDTTALTNAIIALLSASDGAGQGGKG